MKTFLRMACAAMLATVLAVAANAQTAYAVDTNSNLYLVNLNTGGKSLLGNTGDFMEGLAYDQTTGRLFATSAGGTLYELNPANGAQMNSWATGLGNIEGLDFAFPNTLWMADFGSPMVMHGWDTTVNGFFNSLNTVSADGAVRALAFNSNSTLAYFVGDQPTFQTLWGFDGINPAFAIGPVGSSFVAAMDMDSSGVMWGLDTAGNVGQFNLGSGAFSLTGPNTGGDFWLDMSMATVPEPATMAILGVGVCALLRRRRK